MQNWLDAGWGFSDDMPAIALDSDPEIYSMYPLNIEPAFPLFLYICFFGTITLESARNWNSFRSSSISPLPFKPPLAVQLLESAPSRRVS